LARSLDGRDRPDHRRARRLAARWKSGSRAAGKGQPPFRVEASPDADDVAKDASDGGTNNRTSGEAATADRPASINDYTREELINHLLTAIGRKWWYRGDAIRAAARRLGFKRTGRQITGAFKSAINGAIRRGLLKYDGQLIRRAK
jgi:hypothetical protein